MDVDTTARLDALEARLRAAEDRLAILDLLNTYGPLVDSAEGDTAARLWTEGGSYAFVYDAELKQLTAPDELAPMYGWPGHLDLVNTGVSHFTGTPKIMLDGNRAKAVGYSFVILRDTAGEGWKVWRAAINRWLLERTGEGWKIAERRSVPLDGSDLSLATMREVMA